MAELEYSNLRPGRPGDCDRACSITAPGRLSPSMAETGTRTPRRSGIPLRVGVESNPCNSIKFVLYASYNKLYYFYDLYLKVVEIINTTRLNLHKFVMDERIFF